MAPQSRLERFEHVTEWPLAAVAIAFLCRVVGEEDAASQAATAAQIEELRAEIQQLAKSITRDGEPLDGESLDGGRVKGVG